MRGRGALSGGSTRGARGAGAERCERLRGFESFGELPRKSNSFLNAAKKQSSQNSHSVPTMRVPSQILDAPRWIAPQLRAQGHVEVRRQKVAPIRGHAAKDRLAVRRDAAARRQWLAAVGAGAAEFLDLLWRPAIKRASLADRCLVTSPVPATDPEHSEPGGAGVRGRGALSGGSTRGARGAGAEPSGAKGCGFESFRELPETAR